LNPFRTLVRDVPLLTVILYLFGPFVYPFDPSAHLSERDHTRTPLGSCQIEEGFWGVVLGSGGGSWGVHVRTPHDPS